MMNERKLNLCGFSVLTESGINRILSHGEYGFVVISANRSSIVIPEHRKDEKHYTNLEPQFIEWIMDNLVDKGITDYNERENIAKEKSNSKELQDHWLFDIRNPKAEKDMNDEIKKSNYAYSPVYGGYHPQGDSVTIDSYEPSYIIYNHKKSGRIDYGDFEKLKEFAIHLCLTYKQDSVYVQPPKEAPAYYNGLGELTYGKNSTLNFKINRDNEMFYTTDKRRKNNPKRFTADIKDDDDNPTDLDEVKNYRIYARKNFASYNTRLREMKQGEVDIMN